MNKPLAPATGSLQTLSIFKNKEWVVPPRPKPGRKPAADIPPTKRKAQNREAQRAFRERRAARVGELEDQMEQIAEENEKEVGHLNARIWQLEADIERCNRLVVSWSMRCDGLEKELSNERQVRGDTQREIAVLRQASFGSNDTVPLPPRHHPTSNPKVATVSPGIEIHITAMEQSEPAFGCGNCRIDTRCECVENALNIMDTGDEAPNTSLKRPRSPSPTTDNKRSRQDRNDVELEDNGMEIDFTTQAATTRPPALTTSASSISLTATTAPDPCGFCQDGSPCVCAVLAAEEPTADISMEPPISLPSSNPAPSASQNPCINGPGTCAQCCSDANSTLFCKSLAATRSDPWPTPNSATRALHNNKDSHFASISDRSNNTAITGPLLSCADAYTTLSRHPAYERASEDPGSWMPGLTTVPTDTSLTAFEVEAASILQTMRFFEKRFGSGT